MASFSLVTITLFFSNRNSHLILTFQLEVPLGCYVSIATNLSSNNFQFFFLYCIVPVSMVSWIWARATFCFCQFGCWFSVFLAAQESCTQISSPGLLQLGMERRAVLWDLLLLILIFFEFFWYFEIEILCLWGFSYNLSLYFMVVHEQ